jgi:hypothetical protein
MEEIRNSMALLLKALGGEQNFTEFFTELCAPGTLNTSVRSSLLH